ncbi:MAG: hypothetical protein WD317_06605 [Balneolaceae bacterium]
MEPHVFGKKLWQSAPESRMKLERVGDLVKNTAEEIIFYIEAKVLKHKKEKYRDRKRQD